MARYRRLLPDCGVNAWPTLKERPNVYILHNSVAARFNPSMQAGKLITTQRQQPRKLKRQSYA